MLEIGAAPVTVIVAYDPKFHERLWKLFPHNPEASSWFTDNPSLAATTAFRNGTMQGAYLILAARAATLLTRAPPAGKAQCTGQTGAARSQSARGPPSFF